MTNSFRADVRHISPTIFYQNLHHKNNYMQHITLSNIFRPTANYTTKGIAKPKVIAKFNAWLNRQEEKRLLWLSISVLGGIGTVLPLTLLAVVFWANNSFALWVLCLTINVPVLILNLAAQLPKVTLPLLFSAWVVNAAIIIYTAISYFIA